MDEGSNTSGSRFELPGTTCGSVAGEKLPFAFELMVP